MGKYNCFLLLLLLIPALTFSQDEKVEELYNINKNIDSSYQKIAPKDSIIVSSNNKDNIALLKIELIQKKLEMKRRANEERKEKKDRKLLEKALLIQEKKAIKEAEKKLRKAQKQASKIALFQENKRLKEERIIATKKTIYFESKDNSSRIKMNEFKENNLSKKKSKQFELAKKVAVNKEKKKAEQLAIIRKNKAKVVSSTNELKKLKLKEREEVRLEKKNKQLVLAKKTATNKEKKKTEQLTIINTNKEKLISSTNKLKESKLKEREEILLDKKSKQFELAKKTASNSKKKKIEQLIVISKNKENLVSSTNELKKSKLKERKEVLQEKVNKQFELAEKTASNSKKKKEEQLSIIRNNNKKIASSTNEIKLNKLRIQEQAFLDKQKEYIANNKKIAIKKENIKQAIIYRRKKVIAYRAELDNLKYLIRERTLANKYEKRMHLQFEIDSRLKEMIAKRNTKFGIQKAKPLYKGEVLKINP